MYKTSWELVPGAEATLAEQVRAHYQAFNRDGFDHWYVELAIDIEDALRESQTEEFNQENE